MLTGPASAQAQSAPAPAELPVPWVVLDADGRISRHNARFAVMLGRDPHVPLAGDLFSAMLAPASQVYFDLGVLPSIQLGQEMREVHLMLLPAGGQELPVLCYGLPDGDQRVSLAVLPIPERRQLESNLISVRNAVEQVPGAVFQLTQGTRGRLRCAYFSGDAPALLGVARPQLHRLLWRMMPRATRRAFASTMADAALSFSLFRFDMAIPGPASGNGEADAVERWLHIQARAQLQPDGQRLWYGHIMDVSQLKRMERELAESHELLRVTLESIGEAVITTDTQGRVRWFNPVAERMSGWSTAEACGRPLDEVLHILDASTNVPTDNVALTCVREGVAQADTGDRLLMSHGGGEIRFRAIEQSVAPIRNAAGRILGAVVVFHDVTEQREQDKEVKRLAALDELTGLFNRGEFKRRMDRLLAEPQVPGTEHTLLYVDLDQFKLINDACGHVAGDDALRKAVEEIKAALREAQCDHLLARIGGDEFAIILYYCGQQAAEAVGRRICARMEDFRFTHQGRPFRLGTSIGLVVIGDRWHDVTSLLQAADTACYAAKEAGRNRVQAWFDSDRVQLRRMGEMQWAARVAEAIDDNRLELYAQRIAPTLGGPEGLHCELLLRLRDNDGSMITPAAFIGAAERFHMATRIDRWVLRRALELLGSDLAAAADISSVSINVSGQSITDTTFRSDLAAQLTAAAGRVDPGRLCFEITETVMANSFTDAEAFVREVRRLGARVAVDDFGVGSAGIGTLKRLPLDCIDYLKIDGDFIRDNFANTVDMVTVRYFQELARTIGARTVAEWVQDDSVRLKLGEMGVDFVQGYLIHRPEPFVDLLTRWSAHGGGGQASSAAADTAASSA